MVQDKKTTVTLHKNGASRPRGIRIEFVVRSLLKGGDGLHVINIQLSLPQKANHPIVDLDKIFVDGEVSTPGTRPYTTSEVSKLVLKLQGDAYAPCFLTGIGTKAGKFQSLGNSLEFERASGTSILQPKWGRTIKPKDSTLHLPGTSIRLTKEAAFTIYERPLKKANTRRLHVKVTSPTLLKWWNEAVAEPYFRSYRLIHHPSPL